MSRPVAAGTGAAQRYFARDRPRYGAADESRLGPGQLSRRVGED